MSFDDNMAEIAKLFIDESMEGLDILESGLLNLNMGEADEEVMNGIFRAAHSIKGGGATFGFTEVSGFAHHVETLLDEIRQGNFEVTGAAVDLLLQSVDCIRDMISTLGEGEVDTTRSDELEVELMAMLADGAADESGADKTSEDSPATSAIAVAGYHIAFRPHPDIFRSANDPLRIFRDLARLGELEVEACGIDELDFNGMDPEECLLHWNLTLHTQVEEVEVREAFAWVTDECELNIELIAEEGSGEGQCAQNESAAAQAGSETNQASAAESGTQAASARGAGDTKPDGTKQDKAAAKAPARAAASSGDSGSIRVNIGKVDELINLVGELVITQSMLSRFQGDFDFTQLQSLREGLSQLSRNTRELQESVMAIRMLPISFAFSRFPRLVRDSGQALGKKVDLRLLGEHTEMDKTVLEKIGDPLVHLVRNSLDHGLETPEPAACQ